MEEQQKLWKNRSEEWSKIEEMEDLRECLEEKFV